MRIWIALLVLFVLIFSSCSRKSYQSIEQAEYLRPAIFSDDFSKGVYQSSYTFYNRNITGITVIKKTDSSFRVVSVSEIGLKYFDMEFFTYPKKDPVIHYVMDVLKRKLLLKRLTFDFNLLFNYPKTKVKVNSTNVKSGKYYYSGKPVTKTISKSGLFVTKPVIEIKYFERSYPTEIDIKRNGINIVFKEL